MTLQQACIATAETNQHEIAQEQADRRYTAQLRGANDDCDFQHVKHLNEEWEPLEHLETFEILKAFSECSDPVAFHETLKQHMKTIAVTHAMQSRGYELEHVTLPKLLELGGAS